MHKVYSRLKFESAVPVLRWQTGAFWRCGWRFPAGDIRFIPAGSYFGP